MKEKVNEFKEREVNEENVLQEYEELVKSMKEAVNEATPGRRSGRRVKEGD